MQFKLSVLVAAMAATAVSAASLRPSVAQAQKLALNDTAADGNSYSLAEFTDSSCSEGQTDFTFTSDSGCVSVNSDSYSLDVWYIDDGCTLALYDSSGCGGDAVAYPTTYQCTDTSDIYFYQLYC